MLPNRHELNPPPSDNRDPFRLANAVPTLGSSYFPFSTQMLFLGVEQKKVLSSFSIDSDGFATTTKKKKKTRLLQPFLSIPHILPHTQCRFPPCHDDFFSFYFNSSSSVLLILQNPFSLPSASFGVHLRYIPGTYDKYLPGDLIYLFPDFFYSK